jgi:hypothetical protein
VLGEEGSRHSDARADARSAALDKREGGNRTAATSDTCLVGTARELGFTQLEQEPNRTIGRGSKPATPSAH